MSVADSLFAYSFAALLLTLTPGLDTALILRTATVEGGKKAFQAALGIDTGCFIWGAAVAFGLGALLAASELAYDLLKWCGAVYLCWLGIQLILKPRRHFVHQDRAAAPASNWFVKGMMGNVLNPKMGIFYVSFLPQFYSGRALAHRLDVPAGRHSCGDRHNLVINADCDQPLCRSAIKNAAVHSVDGSRDRRPLYAVCCQAGF
ncbi:threonine efflux protein [Klebsiella oxytoca]|nr:threonine efflux protein [Klebsiella oxytoca]